MCVYDAPCEHLAMRVTPAPSASPSLSLHVIIAGRTIAGRSVQGGGYGFALCGLAWTEISPFRISD